MKKLSLGKFTPLQADVLDLGGVVCGVLEDLVKEQDRINAMRQALKSLQKRTGQDFGYDIEKWHQFLQTSDEFSEEYTFKYAWGAIPKAVNELLTDEDRLRLVELARCEPNDDIK